MDYEEIEKLDKIISKRLGKKANALWQEAKNDLFAANIIRNNITKIEKFEDVVLKEDYTFDAKMYVSYMANQLNKKDREFITNWLKENVDKESLKKWLEEDTTNGKIN